MIIIVYGVTGCGKSTIGELLANKMELPFLDADDFHPKSNKTKMNAGIPLDDEDRIPWLRNVAKKLQDAAKEKGAVLACSALNEKYRNILKVTSNIEWILLDGKKSLVEKRLGDRVGHFMNPALLASQMEALEVPDYGLKVTIDSSPEKIVQDIIKNFKKMESKSDFGVIGMGVMGKSLALNLADNGVNISIYNRYVEGKEEGVAAKVLEENPAYLTIQPFENISEFVASLSSPKSILLMIPAGKAVDLQIQELIPLLNEGDIIIDGGNSFYKDTIQRSELLKEKGILFVGTGVSGGEEGARRGPSIMPGGDKEGFSKIKGFLEKIAAKDFQGNPCVTYVGPGGSGHFVKMVHNSIEYGEMQAIAEVYSMMRNYLQLDPIKIASIFEKWMDSDLSSYLLEITIDILRKYENGEPLIDKILDQAAQKGTGGWSLNTALEYGVPYGVLGEAVMARNLSARKGLRMISSGLYDLERFPGIEDVDNFLDKLQAAYQATRIINHEVGFSLMLEVSEKNNWALNFSEIARIWTSGCIIRSKLMEELVEIFKESNHILLNYEAIIALKSYQGDLSYVVGQALQNGFAVPVLSNAINYLLGVTTANSPANLIQAQRDYFGAHTYRRNDKDADQAFHTNWKE